ncbi:serine hydrolase domain-containing protein [Rhizobium sp. BK251]|uniref:serine hydrolase domain-containing protein n=1 Tax=Rhizobium sp. BK251 TaxID=2512125 RepID=UPI001A9E9BF5|nr:serine hydrolase domain-containing protein [Rhizobium sp. BK251]
MSSFEQVRRAVEEFDRRTPLNGVIRVVHRDEVTFEQAFGWASAQLQVPNTVETKFHIASITKMFIAAAVMRLIDEGLVKLDDSPARYHADFQALDAGVTIHHLLSNTSGLADIYAVPDLRLVVEQIVRDGRPLSAYLSSMNQAFVPGERWSYSSTNFLILSYVIEVVCGQPFEAALRDLLFEPLGMRDTGEDDPFKVNPGRAYGHVRQNGIVYNAENDKLARVTGPRELFSTVTDLTLWSHALLNGQILSPDAERLTFRSYGTVDFDPNLGYGYGWFLGRNFRLIGGGTPGFRSEFWQFPDKQLTVIMLWNEQSIDSHKLFRTLRPLLFA